MRGLFSAILFLLVILIVGVFACFQWIFPWIGSMFETATTADGAFMTALVFGSLGFWAVAGVSILLLVFFLDDARLRLIPASITIVATSLLLGFANSSVAMSMADRVWYIAGVYGSGGLVWFLIKWVQLVFRARSEYDDTKYEWLVEQGVTDPRASIPAELRESWSEYCRINGIDAVAPNWRSYRDRIVAWALFWPFSVISTILRDFIRGMWDWVVRQCSRVLDEISKWGFRGVDKDFEGVSNPPTTRRRYGAYQRSRM